MGQTASRRASTASASEGRSSSASSASSASGASGGCSVWHSREAISNSSELLLSVYLVVLVRQLPPCTNPRTPASELQELLGPLASWPRISRRPQRASRWVSMAKTVNTRRGAVFRLSAMTQPSLRVASCVLPLSLYSIRLPEASAQDVRACVRVWRPALWLLGNAACQPHAFRLLRRQTLAVVAQRHSCTVRPSGDRLASTVNPVRGWFERRAETCGRAQRPMGDDGQGGAYRTTNTGKQPAECQRRQVVGILEL